MKVDPRYLTEEGPQIFTGSELMLKGALEATGGTHLLGGYPGSPIAGFFDSMALIKDLLTAKGIRAVLNNNEALAAAMLNGSQTLAARGIICMKSVGVHVAADALALGNMSGAHPQGGAIVVYGDDPWSDSTQVAADSRYISKHLYIPTIEPANAQEVKDYIDLSFKLSARSELYAGYIITTNLADGGGTVICRPNQYPQKNTLAKFDLETAAIDLDKRVLLPPRTWWQEASFPGRFERAQTAARDLGLNQILYPSATRKPLAFVTSGMAHSYLSQVLWEMGLLGDVPILKFGLTYPIDPEMIRRLYDQAQRIVVIEERRGFMEEQISSILLADRQSGRAPQEVELWGKQFPGGLKGIPEIRGLHPSIITERLVPLLKHLEAKETVSVPPETTEAMDREIRAIESTGEADMRPLPMRSPTFCPGCPHRDSSSLCIEIKKNFADPSYMQRKYGRDPVDLVFHGDIGCYTMLMFPPTQDLMHNLSGMGLGGGTGAGIDPFIANKQAVFMGDSTFFHCGALGISQAIKIGQDITFIILDNSTTGMTGHQTTPGLDFDVLGKPTPIQDIEEVIRGITAETDVPVARIDPERRDEYGELLERTLLADGVKILIATKECGITRMRRQRRAEREVKKELGYLPAWQHMNINQDICRFCLACSELTGCPGLKHVQTDYGPKMDTDITWCVDDGACARIGACWSFEHVVIHRKNTPRTRVPELHLDDIPEPQKRVHGDIWRCCLAGVGGMGVGLATQILVRAGHKEGHRVIFLDKKGLAIRNGGVVSQVVYNPADEPLTALIPYGKADLLIGVDVMEAARAFDPAGRTRVGGPETTAAVVNTHKVSTIRGIMGEEDFSVGEMERIIRKHSRPDDYMARDISLLCEKYLGSKLYANIMLLGFAFQKGLIPVSMHAMAWAIKDTIKADFRKNLYAFNMGRKLVEDPDLFQGPPQRTDWQSELEAEVRNTIRRYGNGADLATQLRTLTTETLETLKDLPGGLKRDIVVRMYDTMRWGGIEYAKRYAARIIEIHAKDSATWGFSATQAVVHNLAAAMLIKDAVFIAELATSPEKYVRDRRKYNVNIANGDWIDYRHLIHQTVKLGPWSWRLNFSVGDRVLNVLKRMKWLRKALPGWHRRKYEYLAQYEKIIAQFNGQSDEAYQAGLVGLGARQCMNCLNPRCQEAGCPLGSLIPTWLMLCYDGKMKAAADALHEANNFPEFTAQICPAPCQGGCKQTLADSGVQIRDVEQKIIEEAFAKGWVQPRPAKKRTGKTVAIVGSGPAGLTAAQELARKGHDVTVFEAADATGGMLRYGIPDWRLEKSLIDRRVKQLEGEGVTFRTGTTVGRDVTGSQLQDAFDAICLAAGARRARDLDVPGRETATVHYAWDYLAQQNRRGAGKAVEAAEGIDAKDKVVVVLGGGETGNDCAETALAQGAKMVHQLEIVSRDSVQLDPMHSAPKNVERRYSVATKAFNGNGTGRFDLVGNEVRWNLSAGGMRMVDVPESQFHIEADIALLALGFDATVPEDIAQQLGLERDNAGKLVCVDHATSVDGVFAAGDLVSGPSLVATAMASGRTAAARIDHYLK